MVVYRELEQVPARLEGCVLTIGNFDGVHRGHQQILTRARHFVGGRDAAVVVMTFDPHPLTVVAPHRAPVPLMSAEQKIQALDRAGADVVILVPSTPELLSLPPRQFVLEVIVQRLRPRHIVEGWSFGFGKERRGTPQLLQQLGVEFGFELCVVEPVKVTLPSCGSIAVSSSLVRRLLGEGCVEEARQCLGRAYTLAGIVQPGRGRGRELGFPTANLGAINQLIPANGVYAAVARVQDRRYVAAVSIGPTPTFGGDTVQVEAHLLDCGRDLYEQRLELSFSAFLRHQQRFPSAEALQRQLERDVQRVREVCPHPDADTRAAS